MDEIHLMIDRAIRTALEEDLGSGDVTTRAVLANDPSGTAYLIAREEMILAGMHVFELTFQEISRDITFQRACRDGELMSSGQVVSTIHGSLGAILKGERTALNFLQRMSGIATLTHRYVEKVKGTRAEILDTRKTAPGLRWFDKYAVRTGGGRNHRFGLSDGVLIKDNHIASAGSITRAVKAARERVAHTLAIEVEVENLAGVEEALRAQADIILLDNMPLETLKKAVALVDGAVKLEASGGISLKTVSQIAKTGVDFISVGELTHSAKAADFSLKIEPLSN
jgi:nicotinate-nucleotide pyrophosphorylase (carboxylating)